AAGRQGQALHAAVDAGDLDGVRRQPDGGGHATVHQVGLGAQLVEHAGRVELGVGQRRGQVAEAGGGGPPRGDSGVAEGVHVVRVGLVVGQRALLGGGPEVLEVVGGGEDHVVVVGVVGQLGVALGHLVLGGEPVERVQGQLAVLDLQGDRD